jgi:inosine triphosphate pyrophosphatase
MVLRNYAPVTWKQLILFSLGWDRVFEFDGETYAEMEAKKKNSVSHRAFALSKLLIWLKTQI